MMCSRLQSSHLFRILTATTIAVFLVMTISWKSVFPRSTAVQSANGAHCTCIQQEGTLDDSRCVHRSVNVDIHQSSTKKKDKISIDDLNRSGPRMNMDEEPVLETVATIQEQRQQLMLDACHEHGQIVNNSQPPWQWIAFNDQLQYLFCVIGKVSCTSWKATLMMLTGKITKFKRPEQMSFLTVIKHEVSAKYMRRMSKLQAVNRERRMGSYFTFMFVREPLERLVSAYRDKLFADPFYHVDVDIVRKYRPHYYKPSVKRYNVTFAELVRYVLDQRAAGHTLDRHWLPQSELCQPCRIRYDFVGHYETLHKDADFVVRKLKSGIQDEELRRTVENVTFPVDNGHRKSSQFVQRMYATVPSAHIQALYRLYAVDYALFGFKHPNVTGAA